ncbi:MAG: FAD-binding oxidoreductase [Chloroflexota bacterium]|nr:FAD-binding oxidoreductase [Chloroflexota bacterium]
MTGRAGRTAEVVVVGGGVIGASVAYQLSARGVRDVTLLERRQLGAGATGKSGALVRCHYANVPEARLTLESLRIFRDWDAVVGHGDPGFEAVGFVQVVDPGDEDKLRSNVAAQRAIGVETAVVSADDLHEIEPLMRTDDLSVAAFEPRSGFADPNGTVYGFAAGAAANGAAILTETPATAVLVDADRVVGVRTPTGSIATGTVVIAAGAWADRLLRTLGIDWGLVPVRVQVVVFRWPPAVDGQRRHRAVIDATRHSWFRPEGRAGTLIGAERAVDRTDPDDLDETVDRSCVEASRAALAARFPAFATATMRGGWAGTFMRSPDGHPIIDRVPGIEGLYVVAGDSGTSFKTSPAIGVCLAEWIIDGAPKLADLAPFRSGRFAEGRPWHDQQAYGDDRRLTVSR